MKNSDFGGAGRRFGAAAAIALTLAAAVATGSDSEAQTLGVRTPSVSIEAPGVRVDVPPVDVTPPTTPVAPPKVTLPSAPVEPPVELPASPVKAPSVPVERPSLPVEPRTMPGGRSLPDTPSSPRAEPSPPPGLSQPGSSPASGPRSPSPSALPAGPGAARALPARPGAGTALSPGQRRQLLRRALDSPLPERGLRKLRATIREYGGCLGALPDRGRRALELRAGLFGNEPASGRVVARRLGTSPMRALQIERSALRRLIGAGERGRCAGADALAAIASTAANSGGPAETAPGEGGGSSPRSASESAGSDPRPAGEVLADVHEGGPGIDLGDGEQGATETLLFLLLTLLALLGPLAAVAVAIQRRPGAGAAAGERPLLFLDVDGVIALSVFSKALPPGQMRESPLGFIHLPDRTGELVRELATRFDIVWATGWEHHANASLLRPLGLRDELPVLTFGKKARGGSSDWKIKRVNAYAGHRPAAWLDDNFRARHERWAAHRPEPTLLVRVDPRAGLTPDHVTRLLRWADRVAASQVAKLNGQRRARAS